MHQEKVLLFKANKTYNADYTPLAKSLDMLTEVYLSQYEDFTSGSIRQINEIIEVGSTAFFAYRFFAKQESVAESIKSIHGYTLNELIDALDSVCSMVSSLSSATSEYYPFKNEKWYSKGIAGKGEDKSGDYWLNQLATQALILREHVAPKKTSSPGSETLDSSSPSSSSRTYQAGDVTPESPLIGRRPPPPSNRS